MINLDVVLDWLNTYVKPWLVSAWLWMESNPCVWVVILAVIVLVVIGSLNLKK